MELCIRKQEMNLVGVCLVFEMHLGGAAINSLNLCFSFHNFLPALKWSQNLTWVLVQQQSYVCQIRRSIKRERDQWEWKGNWFLAMYDIMRSHVFMVQMHDPPLCSFFTFNSIKSINQSCISNEWAFLDAFIFPRPFIWNLDFSTIWILRKLRFVSRSEDSFTLGRVFYKQWEIIMTCCHDYSANLIALWRFCLEACGLECFKP